MMEADFTFNPTKFFFYLIILGRLQGKTASIFFTAIPQCLHHDSSMIHITLNELKSVWMNGFDISFKIQSLLESIEQNHITFFTYFLIGTFHLILN